MDELALVAETYVPHRWVASDDDAQCVACAISESEYEAAALLGPLVSCSRTGDVPD